MIDLYFKCDIYLAILLRRSASAHAANNNKQTMNFIMKK